MKILFSMVSVCSISEELVELLVKSAKKYFLINHDVEFVVFTDIETPPPISDVEFILIDNSFSTAKSYYQFQKILSLNYIDLNLYDYVFVHDVDQVYVGTVSDDDLLTNDLCILNHFFKEDIKLKIDYWSGIINIDQHLEHTMGNFWGGPTHFIKLLLLFANDFWNKNKNYKNERVGFFSEHSEEVMLMKFIDFYRIKEKRITSTIEPGESAFLTCIFNPINERNIKINEGINNFLHNFKLIHDTKINLEFSNELFNKSCKQ